LYDRLRSAVDTWGEKWELLVIDDGSTDATLAILQRLHAQDPRVKCISFSRKFGIALLLLCLAASIRHYRLGSDFRLRWTNNGPAEMSVNGVTENGPAYPHFLATGDSKNNRP